MISFISHLRSQRNRASLLVTFSDVFFVMLNALGFARSMRLIANSFNGQPSFSIKTHRIGKTTDAVVRLHSYITQHGESLQSIRWSRFRPGRQTFAQPPDR